MNVQFPLEKVTETQLQRLGQALWSWPSCEECMDDGVCAIDECPFKRLVRLGPFFEYYKYLAASYEPEARMNPALKNHEDIFRIIRILRNEPTISRAQLCAEVFGTQSSGFSIPDVDRQNAIDMAVKTMLMVSCSAQNRSLGLVEQGVHPIPWLGTVPFADFIADAFPKTDNPVINDRDGEEVRLLSTKSALPARKLKQRAGIKFRPTDDLRNHLKLDRREAVVELFHHTAFLKESLRLTKDKKPALSAAESLKLGALPRQLALEALDSMQKVLFPLDDPKSRILLGSLTSTSGFDPDCLRFESSSIRTAEEKDIAYYYFGARLSELYNEMENPTPRGIEKWFERKSGARYVMMATLVGVIIALLLGFMSLAVSVYQAWVGYQQWQHPVSSST